MAEGGITGKGFVKGDKRINRKGRPKSFDELRKLAQQIAHEAIIKNDTKVTRVEIIMRSWAQSKDPRLVQAFIAYAYGKPPDEVNLSGEVKTKSTVIIKGVDYRTAIANLAPRSMDNITASSEDQNTVDGSQVG
jgi:hypothetical protein